MTVQALRPGLWRWTAPHPAWTPAEGGLEGWPREVGSVYLETTEAIVLVDPIVPEEPSERDRFWRALDGDVERLRLPLLVLLTCRWHVRGAPAVRERYGPGAVVVRGPDDGGENLEGLVDEPFEDGEEPAPGVRVVLAGTPPPDQEAVIVLERPAALVVGDLLLGDPLRPTPPSWFDRGPEGREWYAGARLGVLERLAALGPEMILTSHGEPVLAGGAAALRGLLA
jgi:glyoxylase-like metal-dependent hydrolase (beta-lactamase superfamily II)